MRYIVHAVSAATRAEADGSLCDLNPQMLSEAIPRKAFGSKYDVTREPGSRSSYKETHWITGLPNLGDDEYNNLQQAVVENSASSYQK